MTINFKYSFTDSVRVPKKSASIAFHAIRGTNGAGYEPLSIHISLPPPQALGQTRVSRPEPHGLGLHTPAEAVLQTRVHRSGYLASKTIILLRDD